MLDKAVYPAAILDLSAVVSETICLWINWVLRLCFKNIFKSAGWASDYFKWSAKQAWNQTDLVYNISLEK